jgi:hypothetical protein
MLHMIQRIVCLLILTCFTAFGDNWVTNYINTALVEKFGTNVVEITAIYLNASTNIVDIVDVKQGDEVIILLSAEYNFPPEDGIFYSNVVGYMPLIIPSTNLPPISPIIRLE